MVKPQKCIWKIITKHFISEWFLWNYYFLSFFFLKIHLPSSSSQDSKSYLIVVSLGYNWVLYNCVLWPAKQSLKKKKKKIILEPEESILFIDYKLLSICWSAFCSGYLFFLTCLTAQITKQRDRKDLLKSVFAMLQAQ